MIELHPLRDDRQHSAAALKACGLITIMKHPSFLLVSGSDSCQVRSSHQSGITGTDTSRDRRKCSVTHLRPQYVVASSVCVKPFRRHRNPSKARLYLRRRGKSSALIYMSAGRDIIRKIKVQIYRRNEGDIWPCQGDLAFATKNGIGHKQMRGIA